MWETLVKAQSSNLSEEESVELLQLYVQKYLRSQTKNFFQNADLLPGSSAPLRARLKEKEKKAEKLDTTYLLTLDGQALVDILSAKEENKLQKLYTKADLQKFLQKFGEQPGPKATKADLAAKVRSIASSSTRSRIEMQPLDPKTSFNPTNGTTEMEYQSPNPKTSFNPTNGTTEMDLQALDPNPRSKRARIETTCQPTSNPWQNQHDPFQQLIFPMQQWPKELFNNPNFLPTVQDFCNLDGTIGWPTGTSFQDLMDEDFHDFIIS
jgi:hypothetical protein